MCDQEQRLPMLQTAAHILFYIPSYRTFLSGMIEVCLQRTRRDDNRVADARSDCLFSRPSRLASDDLRSDRGRVPSTRVERRLVRRWRRRGGRRVDAARRRAAQRMLPNGVRLLERHGSSPTLPRLQKVSAVAAAAFFRRPRAARLFVCGRRCLVLIGRRECARWRKKAPSYAKLA